MILYLCDPQTGAVVYGPDRREPISDDLLAALAAARPGLLPWLAQSEPGPAAELQAVIADGQVVDLVHQPPPALYLVLEASGGAGRSALTGRWNLAADGGASPQGRLEVAISLRGDPDDPASAVDLEGEWIITLRREDGGAYENLLVPLVGGSAAVTYTSPGPALTVHVDPADLAGVLLPVGETAHQVILARELQINIYRPL